MLLQPKKDEGNVTGYYTTRCIVIYTGHLVR